MVDDQQRHLDIAAKMGMTTVLYSTVEKAGRDIFKALAE